MLEFFFGLFLGELLCTPPPTHDSRKTCRGKEYGCLYCSSWNAPICPYHDYEAHHLCILENKLLKTLEEEQA